MVSKLPKSQRALPLVGEVIAIRPDESQVAEGNVLEHPLFKLSNKEARPNRGRDTDGKLLFVAEDYVRIYELDVKWMEDGGRRHKMLEVHADIHSGYPTMFAFRVLLAVIDKANKAGWFERSVRITRSEICSALGFSAYGGRQFKLIDNALHALQGMSLNFHDTWYDFTGKKTHPGVRTEHLVTGFSFEPERKATKGQHEQLSFDRFQYVELGKGLFESLQEGYRIGVDLDYINHLGDNLTAQRLYSYLTKKDRGSRYVENLKSLALKLPLSEMRPSDIKRALKPALELLCEPLGSSGKRFLHAFHFEGSRDKQQLVADFFGHISVAAARP